ncbi:MAG: RNA polymerase factor sigma-54 [Pseudomonadota bacterium]
MKPTLQLRIGQQLSMTPQLQQAIRLLQLSTLELQMEVQQALDSNMMLEREDELDGASAEDLEAVDPLDIPGELEVDSAWEDIYEPSSAPSSLSAPEPGIDSDIQHGAEQSLSERLYWQAELARFSPEDALIAAAVIDAIDDSGYLSLSLEDVHESLRPHVEDIELDQVQAVLTRIQQFEPPGVGARDLRECLLIQLDQLPEDTPWREEAQALVGDCLQLLGNRDFAQVMRLLRLDREQLQEVMALIQLLSPRPGEAVDPKPPEYVVPDVVVSQRNGEWQVELNQEALPRLRINDGYASLIRRADSSPENTSMRTHLQEARWFIKSLQSRSETLLKVARCIVERQRDFFDEGPEAMKPMVLHDVAEVVEMHESTISRVTTQKYMLTPRGVFELKYFFSSHVSTDSGGEASSTAIRAILKKLIASENPVKPLSDSKLAKMLSDQGINVARRTVAKYRESLMIPSSSERKRLV